MLCDKNIVNMPVILKVLNMREYALGECSNMSEYA